MNNLPSMEDQIMGRCKHFTGLGLMEDDKRCKRDLSYRALVGGEGVTGSVKCPACGGDLQYSRAGCNGHIWGQCQTKDCLSWMQ